MARIGSFDPELDPLSWFDTESRPEGWFDEELIVAELAAGALEPPFLLSGNQFYAASVSAGPVTLTASLYSNAQSFPAHSISQTGGLQTLTAGLYTNASAFYGPLVSAGAVTLSPILYAPGNTFYQHVIVLPSAEGTGGGLAIAERDYKKERQEEKAKRDALALRLKQEIAPELIPVAKPVDQTKPAVDDYAAMVLKAQRVAAQAIARSKALADQGAAMQATDSAVKTKMLAARQAQADQDLLVIMLSM